MTERAFLTWSGQMYYADAPSGNGLSADTAVTRLIEGIWDQHPQHAFHLLRSRIYTHSPLSLRCRGAISLAAKRATVLPPEEFSAAFAAATSQGSHVVAPRPVASFAVDLPSQPRLTPAEFAGWISTYPFATSDRPILAAIADSAGTPILAAPNTSSANRLRHAEVNVVREYVRRFGTRVPAGASLWVSLKPCRMCAGFIHDLFEDGSRARVYYLQDDPGPKARNSPLTAMVEYRPG